MRIPKDLRPIQMHQLCAIARTVLTTDPAISDAEWKERTKVTLAKQGYDYQDPEMLMSALGRVEQALVETLGPRPTFAPPQQTATQKPQQDDPPWSRTARSARGCASVADLIVNLQGYISSAPRSSALSETSARETLDVAEHDALNEFWRHAGVDGANRMEILRVFSELAIVRPNGWDPAAIRAQADDHTLFAESCFCCRSSDRALDWHHVIQVQHGGSNAPRNRVALCGLCHSAVHPWLPVRPRRGSGWTSFGDLVADADGSPRSAVRDVGFVSVRTWREADSELRCGFDWDHAIRKGEWFLEMEVAPNVTRLRCRKCAVTRHGETAPTEAIPVAQEEQA